MKEMLVQLTERVCTPYIINAHCDCGGIFAKTIPIKFHPSTGSIQHTCSMCGKIMYFRDCYPIAAYKTDSEMIKCGTVEGIVDIDPDKVVEFPANTG